MPAAQAYVLVDTVTGRIIDSSNDHLPLSPASLTKMLTALVATDYLPPGTPIPVSVRAENVEPDKIGMKAGEVWPLDEVIQALLIISANDAAYALAEKIGGTAENFDPVLQDAAAQIGMEDNPVFHDPSGLDDSHGIDDGNLVSARDLAIAGRDLLSVPRLAQIVASPAVRYTGPNGTVYDLASHNRAFLRSYPGAVGVKTGYTDKAGVCLAAAATRDGRTMLAVVLHGVNPDQTASMLLDQGFATPVAAEPKADALPRVRLPEATPAPSPASAAVAPAGVPAPAVAHHVAAASTSGGLLAGLRPGAGGLDPMWSAPVAAVILGIVALFTIRRLRTRHRPLTHGRRR
jgi:D-alanyl-D-alanine carboxypeptidase (penicillin-binding protein 5/6)